MEQLNTYLKLCTLFYEWSKPTPPDDAYFFYKSYVDEANGPILEPMCGSGRFLLPLVNEGYSVEGFDASEHMIQSLNKKADILGIKPIVWAGYAQDFKPTQQYDLIIIPNGSLGLIIDTNDLQKALNAFSKALKPGGKLVLDIETVNAVPPEFGVPRSSVYTNNDKMIIGTFFDLPPEDNIGTTICRYELVQDSKIIDTEVETFKIRLHDAIELQSHLQNAGFSNIVMKKVFSRDEAPSSDDELVVIECVRNE